MQDEFAAELATLESRVENLEARTDELETKQFFATTQFYLTNPEHNNANDNIVVGTIRTVFNF